MRKTAQNLITLNAVFVACLIISNVITCKVINIFGFAAPAGFLVYPFTFLCTDVIGELWGRKEANKTVRLGMIIQLIALGLITLANILPPAEFAKDFQQHFNAVLGQNWRFVVASLTAYLVAQYNDVLLFHMFKDKHGDKKRWIRNNVSTMTSQMFDTVIYISIAFIGTVPNILELMVVQYALKFIMAALDTPIFYLLTNKYIKEQRQLKSETSN